MSQLHSSLKGFLCKLIINKERKEKNNKGVTNNFYRKTRVLSVRAYVLYVRAYTLKLNHWEFKRETQQD